MDWNRRWVLIVHNTSGSQFNAILIWKISHWNVPCPWAVPNRERSPCVCVREMSFVECMKRTFLCMSGSTRKSSQLLAVQFHIDRLRSFEEIECIFLIFVILFSLTCMRSAAVFHALTRRFDFQSKVHKIRLIWSFDSMANEKTIFYSFFLFVKATAQMVFAVFAYTSKVFSFSEWNLEKKRKKKRKENVKWHCVNVLTSSSSVGNTTIIVVKRKFNWSSIGASAWICVCVCVLDV